MQKELSILATFGCYAVISYISSCILVVNERQKCSRISPHAGAQVTSQAVRRSCYIYGIRMYGARVLSSRCLLYFHPVMIRQSLTNYPNHPFLISRRPDVRCFTSLDWDDGGIIAFLYAAPKAGVKGLTRGCTGLPVAFRTLNSHGFSTPNISQAIPCQSSHSRPPLYAGL